MNAGALANAVVDAGCFFCKLGKVDSIETELIRDARGSDMPSSEVAKWYETNYVQLVQASYRRAYVNSLITSLDIYLIQFKK